MNSTLGSKQTNVADALIARLEEANARAYEQEQSTQKAQPVDIPPSTPGSDTSYPSELKPSPGALETPQQQAASATAKRRPTLLFVLLMMCIGLAAVGWHLSRDNAIANKISAWMSEFMPNLSKSFDQRNYVTRATVAGEQKIETVTPQPLPPTQSPKEKSAPATTAQSSAMEQVLLSMARELAVLRQSVDQLKVGQEQMARDNAATIDHLKASLDQSARDNAQIAGLLKMSQEQASRDNAQIAEQLQENQDQIARLSNRSARRNPSRTSAQDTIRRSP